jgi:Zn-dependent peptidase ImmA (M78 family)/transcriptional regulator with XRE-family HTH domain
MQIEVVGDRVRQGRILRRLTNAEVAEAMAWSQATQTRTEKSTSRELDESTAAKLARTLRVPIGFLTATATAPLSDDSLRYRAPRSTTQQEKQYLTEFARFAGELAFWLDNQHRLPPVRVPRLPAVEDPTTAACAAREVLGFAANEPITHLTHAIERQGVPVVMRVPPRRDYDRWEKDGDASIEIPERGERHFGCSTWIGQYQDRPFVFLRAISSWERTRWTVAHELGHVALHHSELPSDAEVAASRFASELLAPASIIRNELENHVTLADLVPLKLKWGISIGALIRHLLYSKLITSDRANALQKQLYTRINPTTGRTWGVDEPGWDNRQPERPRLLSRWAERCVGTANPNAIENLTGKFPSDLVESIFAGQRGRLSAQAASLKESDRKGSTEDNHNVIDLSSRRRGYDRSTITPDEPDEGGAAKA